MTSLEDRLKSLSPRKLALLARDLERRDAATREPIAIVGLACRFPGGARSPDAFWRRLRDGADLHSKVPADRWDAEAFYDPEPGRRGGAYVRHGYFLEAVDQFDPGFFGLSPREAKAMDPQHRLMLECVWEALEDAGRIPADPEGTETGVFMGVYGDEHIHLQLWAGTPDAADAHTGVGSSHSAGVGRISHLLGLTGPSMAIDTACSSSLVALHLACESLRRRECETSLAGGASLALSPETPITLSRANMLSPDGRCKTFDASADGYGRGEGCGVVVLKRLSDAQAAGDRVLAVVRGSAINHDGRASSLTAPNGPAQEAVVRRALAAAGLAPGDVDYVETHGTGTPLGDPIELQALQGVHGGRERPLGVGSVKSNIGHLEAAAGIAGVIKMVLSLHNEELPAHLNFSDPNLKLGLMADRVEVVAERRTWARDEKRARVAGVSSFGFSGTNAHVVLAEGPATPQEDEAPPPSRVLALSARSATELQELAGRFEARLADDRDRLIDISHTAHTGRVHHRHRLAVDAEDRDATRAALAAFRLGTSDRAWATGELGAAAQPNIAFLFSGQGAQFAGMGAELYEAVPHFRTAIDQADAILRGLGVPLTDILYGERGAEIDQTGLTQPVLFAFEWALAETWRARGVIPASVMGHSLGEYVAACAAGVFDLETGLRLVTERARLMQALPAGGAMAALMVSEAKARELIAGTPLSVAAVNGAAAVVVSGPEAELAALLARDAAVGRQRLTVSHAFHSALMDPMLDTFERFVGGLQLNAPRLPLISNLTGTEVRHEVTQPSYWRDHLRQEVRFADGIKTAVDAGTDLFLEIGPGTTLTALGKRSAPDAAATWAHSLRRGRSDRLQMRDATRQLYLAGAELNWTAVEADTVLRGRPVSVPTYPFARQRIWHDAAAQGKARLLEARRRSVERDPLVGERLPLAIEDTVYATRFEAGAPDFLADHCLFENVVVPGAAYAAMILTAAAQAWPDRRLALEDVVFAEPMALVAGAARDVQVVLDRSGAAQIASRPLGAAEWTIHAEAQLTDHAEAPNDVAPVPLDGEAMAGQVFYREMAEAGFNLGAAFQWIKTVTVGGDQAVATLRAPSQEEAVYAPLFPGFLDACLQLLAAAHGSPAEASAKEIFVPIAIERLSLLGAWTGETVGHVSLRAKASGEADLMGDVLIADPTGRAVLRIEGVHARRISRAALQPKAVGGLHYEIAWRPIPAATTGPAGRWLIVGADTSEVADLTAALQREGADAIPVSVGPLADIDPDRLATVAEALAAHRDEGPIAGVVFAAMETASQDAKDGPAILEAQRGVTGLALTLAQDLASGGERLWVLTRRATGDQPTQAALWGLGRVIALEHPEIWGGAIDLVGSVPAGAAAAALGTDTDALRISPDGWKVPRLIRVEPTTAGPAPVDKGSYLVTGGYGALGLRLAEWLAERGATRVALVGRSQASKDARDRIAQIEAKGVAVLQLAGDVAQIADVQALMAEFSVSGPPLRGVFHCAGELDDGIIAQQSWDRVERVMAPKIAGAWNLHLATSGLDLKHFVLFSSAAALIGSPGQSGYAAANAFLDGLAQHRRAQGLPAASLAWGPWAGGGMAEGQGQSAEGSPLRALAPEAALKAMEAALSDDRPQVGIMDAAFEAWVAPVGIRADLLAELTPKRRPGTATAPRAAAFPVEALIAAPPEARPQILLELLREELARVLEADVATIDPGASLIRLGLDSLMAMELRNRVKRELEVALPVVDLLKGPSLEELSANIAARMAPRCADSVEADQFPDDLSALGDDEVDALLKEMLNEVAL